MTHKLEIQCRPLCSIFCNRCKVRLILICASHIVIADNDSRLSGILPNEVTMNQVKAFKLKYHKEVYIQKRRLSMPGQSILFDHWYLTGRFQLRHDYRIFQKHLNLKDHLEMFQSFRVIIQ